MCGVMKIRIVVSNPAGRKKTMFCGDVMAEGVCEVLSGV